MDTDKTEEIIERYWSAMVEITHQTSDILSDDAILLALRLAVADAYEAGKNSQRKRIQSIQDAHDRMAAIIAAQKTIGPELRQAEADRAQMALIAEWLAENEPALYYGEHGGYGDAIIEAVRRRDSQIAAGKRNSEIEHTEQETEHGTR